MMETAASIAAAFNGFSFPGDAGEAKIKAQSRLSHSHSVHTHMSQHKTHTHGNRVIYSS